MRTNAEIETLLTEIEGREQKATPKPWVRKTVSLGDGDVYFQIRGDNGYGRQRELLQTIVCAAKGKQNEQDLANIDFAISARTDIPALATLVRELMQQLDSLRRVGGTMANVMYNVKQRSPLVITEREREIIAALQQEWDLLSRSVPQEDKQ